jgi:hypothetical protein
LTGEAVSKPQTLKRILKKNPAVGYNEGIKRKGAIINSEGGRIAGAPDGERNNFTEHTENSQLYFRMAGMR